MTRFVRYGVFVVWRVYGLLRRPAVIKLPHWNCRLYLPSTLHFGTTSIFLFRETYEPELLYLQNVLHPGDVFIDAGASIGIFTVVASRLVGDAGCVLAFEPADGTIPVLHRNVQINRLGNVRIFKQALSEKEGTRELYHVYGAPTYSLGGTGRDSELFEEVQVTTIDQAVRAANLGPVSCIKIDVEGAEELVLRGAKETIERSRPTIIFEVNRDASDRLGLDPDRRDFLAEDVWLPLRSRLEGRPRGDERRPGRSQRRCALPACASLGLRPPNP